MANGTTVKGTVERVHGNGLQLAEVDGKWFNLSQHAPPDVKLPERGSYVELSLNSSGRILAIRPLAETLATEGRASERDLRISRMASVNAAIAYVAACQDYNSAPSLEAVLEMAQDIFTWVTQD